MHDLKFNMCFTELGFWRDSALFVDWTVRFISFLKTRILVQTATKIAILRNGRCVVPTESHRQGALNRKVVGKSLSSLLLRRTHNEQSFHYY